MVKRVDLGPSTAGAHRVGTDRQANIAAPGGSAASPGSATRGARLGRRGHALFDRLFGGTRGAGPAADGGPGPATVDQPAAARTVRECPVVAIGSGKGGTGKSFLATSLAIEVHRLGHRVVLVDCDFGLACDHLLLDVQPTRHLRHLVSGEAQLDEVVVTCEAGPRLLPGVTGIRQMANLSSAQLALFGRALSTLAADADLVLLDCGAGLTPQLCALQAAADHVVLVAQPELAALTDAYAVVKTLTQLRSDPQVGVVVNRVQELPHGEATWRKLAEVARQHAGIDLHALGAVADDPQVTQKRLGQQPLVVTDPERDVCEQLRSITDELIRWCDPLGPRDRLPHTGFADRLADQGRMDQLS